MKIDHVVLDPHNHSIQKLIVSAKEGAVRWISGNSMSGAYQIDTPHAVITDEGTAFDLVVEPQRTLVLLHTGRATVCAVAAPGRCKTLLRRGDMVLATTEDVMGPWESGLEPSGFETQCLNAKCAITAFVPTPQPPSNGDRKEPERAPEPRHAGVPARPGTGETVVPSGPREVVLPLPIIATPPPPKHPPPRHPPPTTVVTAPPPTVVRHPTVTPPPTTDAPPSRAKTLWLYAHPSQPGLAGVPRGGPMIHLPLIGGLMHGGGFMHGMRMGR
jgi:hypothetical protein